MASQSARPRRRRRFSWRLIIGITALLLFAAGAIIWISNIQNIWANVASAIFVILAVAVPFFAWLFPSLFEGTKKSPYVRVSELDCDNFKLGDRTAASFPYIIDPIRPTYDTAIQALHDASLGKKRAKRGILVIGEANAGKTRLSIEAITSTLSDWFVLQWTSEDITEIPGVHKLLVFIDDLQDYAPAEIRSGSKFLERADKSAQKLKNLLKRVREAAQRLVIVATCRAEDERRTRAGLGWLFEELAVVRLQRFDADANDVKAAQIINDFKKQGAEHIYDWDGTLGSLVLGLSRKRSQYEDLVRLGDPAATVLRAMKLLTLAGTLDHTEKRIWAVSAGVFGEETLQADEKIRRDVVDRLTMMQLVMESVVGVRRERLLVIRKDTYFDQVITDYPLSGLPYQLEQDLIRLQEVFVELADVHALLNLAGPFHNLKRYNEELAVAGHVLTIDENNTDAWIAKGIALSALEQYDEALVASDRALTLEPNNADIWNNRGGALAGMERYDEALLAYDHALALDPYNVQAWSLKGFLLATLERHTEAVVASDRALSLDASETWIWLFKGSALISLNQYDEALIAFNRTLALDPNNFTAWSGLGLAFGSLERYQEALAAYERAQAVAPDNARIWGLEGAMLTIMERYAQAIEVLDHSIALNANDAEVWAFKGAAHSALELYIEAVAAFTHSLTSDPSDVTGWVNKGLSFALFNLKRYQEALTSCERALALTPNDANLWYHKGNVLFTLEKYDEAVAALQHAQILDPNELVETIKEQSIFRKRYEENLATINGILVNPSDAAQWFFKGGTLLALRQYNEALVAYERSLELDPNFVPSWNARGDALIALKSYDEALIAYERALKLDPGYIFAWIGKGNVLTALKQYDEALAVYDRALAINSNFVQVLTRKCDILFNLGHYQDALGVCDHVLSFEQGDAITWFLRGKMLLKLERYEEATVAYNRALTLDPNLIIEWVEWFEKALASGVLDKQKLAAINSTLSSPNDANILYFKGSMLGMLERHREALAAFDHALGINPKHALAWVNKGSVLMHLGRKKAALAAFDHALAIDPNLALAWLSRGLILYRFKHYEEALAAVDRAFAISPKLDLNQVILIVKGLLLDRLKRYEEALITFDRALDINPDEARAWYAKRNLLNKLGRQEEALVAQQRALTLDPSLDEGRWDKVVRFIVRILGHKGA